MSVARSTPKSFLSASVRVTVTGLIITLLSCATYNVTVMDVAALAPVLPARDKIMAKARKKAVSFLHCFIK